MRQRATYLRKIGGFFFGDMCDRIIEAGIYLGRAEERAMTQFQRLFCMEWKKAVHNRFFPCAIAFGSLFAMMSALHEINAYRLAQKQLQELGGDPMVQAYTLYNHWIGGETQSFGSTLFYMLIPILAVLPYGWSYCTEKRSGYTNMIMTRSGKGSYLLAKTIAAFLSGGVSVILPLIGNFLLIACFVPAVKPSILYHTFYSIPHGSMWSWIFYQCPVLFVIFYLLLDFLFAGLFAVTAMAFSVWVKNPVVVILLPFLMTLVLHLGHIFLHDHFYKEISPLYFLHAACVQNFADARIILSEAAGMLLFSLIVLGKEGSISGKWSSTL